MTDLGHPLAQQIARFIRTNALRAGDALPERNLAQVLNVSRTPVRSALRVLEQAGVVRAQAQGGHCVASPDRAAAMADVTDDPVYLALARDRLAGLIPDRVTENALLRRYAITRVRLQALLHRTAEEGWAERLPGHGWRFLPVLTNMQTYRESYDFRQAIEPAALRAPGFRADPGVLEPHLAVQRDLVAGAVAAVSPVRLFEISTGLHEAICACSGNSFFLESLRRVNRLRRLIEYGSVIDPDKARLRCAEHVRMLELILLNRAAEAADLMHAHLAALGPIKAPVRG